MKRYFSMVTSLGIVTLLFISIETFAQCEDHRLGGGGQTCNSGGTALIYLSTGQVGVEYTVYKNGSPWVETGLIPVGGWSTQAPVGTYTLKATNGCFGDMIGELTVELISPPGLSLNVNPVGTSFCQGTDVYFSASSGFSGYSWTVNGASFIDGLTQLEDALPGTYNVSVSATSLCGSAQTGAQITIIPFVSALSVSGTATRCQGTGPDQYTASASNASSYGNWSVDPPEAGTISGSSSGLANNTIQWSDGFYGTARIYATAYGCGGSSVSSYKQVIVSRKPIAVPFTGPVGLCFGQNVTLSINNSLNGVTYQLQKVGVGVFENKSGNNSVISFLPVTGTGTYKVVGMSTYCSNVDMSNTLTVFTPSPGTVSATSICGSGNITVSTTGITANTAALWQSRYSDDNGSSWSSWSNFSTAFATSVPFAATQATGINRKYEFKLIASKDACEVTSNNASATVYTTSFPVTPALKEDYTSVPGSGGILTLTKPTTASVVRWESSTDGTSWTPISNTTTSLTYSGVNSSIRYRAVVNNTSCTNQASSVALVTMYAEPSIVAPSVRVLPIGSTMQFTANTTYYQYQWNFNAGDISGATGSSYTVTQPGTYRLKVKGSAAAAWATSAAVIIYGVGDPPDNDYNSITTTIVKKAGVTTGTNLYQTLLTGEYLQQIRYLENLGRIKQEIGIGASPAGYDVVVPHDYDSAGLEKTSYLPYASAVRHGVIRGEALVGSGSSYTTSEQYLFYQNAAKVAHSTAPYAKAVVENSRLGSILEQGAPGTAWQPGQNTTKYVTLTNIASDVRMWTTAGFSGHYAANALIVSKTIDENGNSTFNYVDKAGRDVLKRVQVDAMSFLETYYVYDTKGNLAMQVPPKAVVLINSGTAWSTGFRDKWCFVYTYDNFDRLVEKKAPDAAVVYYGYDPLDRLVLTQDGNLRTSNKWMYMKYDIKGRPVISGFYTNATHTTRTAVQTNVLDVLYSSGVYYEEKGSSGHGYTNQSFPTTSTEVLIVNYYDHYDFDNAGGADYTYTSQSISGEGVQGNSFGLPTGSKKLIIGTSNFLYSYIFYDKFGRSIQVRTNNHLNLTPNDLSTLVYDFEGKVVLTKSYQDAGSGKQTTLILKTSYDHAGRPIKIYSNVNGEGKDQLAAQYKYNELGQLVDKNIHLLYDAEEAQPGVVANTDITLDAYGAKTVIARNSITLKPGFTANAANGQTLVARVTSATQQQAETTGLFLQSMDYRYTIQGWIESINSAKLDNTDSRNDDTNDYFGMELQYDNIVSGVSNTAYYNGNISAVLWKGPGNSGASGQRSYRFTYDKSDRLTIAAFKRYGTAWDKEVDALNESQSYDQNGNILGLLRKQISRGFSTAGNLLTPTVTAQTMDDLTYTYTSAATVANQLVKVDDAGTVDGFNNGVTQATEYTYNTDGSILTDSNKGATVTYNSIGKQATVVKGGTTITYTYDATGAKLKMVTVTGASTTTLDYVNGFVYENNALSFFASPEGRIVKKGNSFERQYSLSDHQGNTRVLFSAATPPADVKKTNMEASSNSNFLNYNNRVSFELMDHTNATMDSTYSQKLTGGSSSMVGVARSFKVYPGDKVKIEGYAKYYNPTSTGSNLASFASYLTTAFGVTSGSVGDGLKTYNTLNSYGGVIAAGAGHPTNGYPRAYVNILLFDKNLTFVDMTYQQIDGGEQTGGTKLPHDYMSAEYTVKEEGYAFMFVSNESSTLVEVYYDDVVMSHTKSNIIQYDEYYPFGAQNGNSWVRENTKGNDYLYNAASELNKGTSWYEMFYRGYDPVLGRMLQVDPMVDMYPSVSGYIYSFNNPLIWNDPNGDEPIFMDGRLMNPRDVVTGQESWGGSDVQAQILYDALAGRGDPTGISIGGRSLSSYDQNASGAYGTYSDRNYTEWHYFTKDGKTYRTGEAIVSSTFTPLTKELQSSGFTANHGLIVTAGMGGFEGPANIIAYLIGTSEVVNKMYYGYQARKTYSNSFKYKMAKAGYSNGTKYSKGVLRALDEYKVMTAVGKGLSKPMFFVGLGLTIVDVVQNKGSASSIGWGIADTGVAAAALLFATGPVGWVIGAGAALYFTGRLAYSIYEAYNEDN